MKLLSAVTAIFLVFAFNAQAETVELYTQGCFSWENDKTGHLSCGDGEQIKVELQKTGEYSQRGEWFKDISLEDSTFRINLVVIKHQAPSNDSYLVSAYISGDGGWVNASAVLESDSIQKLNDLYLTSFKEIGPHKGWPAFYLGLAKADSEKLKSRFSLRSRR